MTYTCRGICIIILIFLCSVLILFQLAKRFVAITVLFSLRCNEINLLSGNRIITIPSVRLSVLWCLLPSPATQDVTRKGLKVALPSLLAKEKTRIFLQ